MHRYLPFPRAPVSGWSRAAAPAILTASLAIAGCDTVKERGYSSILGAGEQAALSENVLRSSDRQAAKEQTRTQTSPSAVPVRPKGPEFLEKGNGRFVGKGSRGPAVPASEEMVGTLKFENITIQNLASIIIDIVCITVDEHNSNLAGNEVENLVAIRMPLTIVR